MLRVLEAAQCSLQAPCLHALAALPCLTELYLAGNQIGRLPGAAITARSFTLLQVSHLIRHCFALPNTDFSMLVTLSRLLLDTETAVMMPHGIDFFYYFPTAVFGQTSCVCML